MAIWHRRRSTNTVPRALTKFKNAFDITSGPGGSVGIATGYELDGPGIESPRGRDFPHLSRPSWGPTSLLYNGYRVFLEDKERPERDADPSPLLVPWS